MATAIVPSHSGQIPRNLNTYNALDLCLFDVAEAHGADKGRPFSESCST